MSARRPSPRVFVFFAVVLVAVSIPIVQIAQKTSENKLSVESPEPVSMSSFQSVVNDLTSYVQSSLGCISSGLKSTLSADKSGVSDLNSKSGSSSGLNTVLNSRSSAGSTAVATATLDQNQSAEEQIASLDLASQQLLLSIDKDPANPSLHNQLGLIYAESGQSDKAIQNFQKAIEIARGQLATLSTRERDASIHKSATETTNIVLSSAKLSTDLAAAHSSLARIYDKLGQHDKVVAELDMLNRDIAFGSTVNSASSHRTTAGAPAVHRLSSDSLQLLARAEALEQAHRTPEAIFLYKEVLKTDPQAGIAHEKLGLAAEASGNYWLAKQELEAALSCSGNNANCDVHLGTIYQALSEPAKAKAQFLKALALEPKNSMALFNLANICASHNQVSEAIQTYQRLVAVNPQMAAGHNNLAMCYSMAHDYPHAIDEYGRALALSPDLASSHYGLGMALYNVKDYRASISELKRALALNPSYLDAREKIELAYKKLNDPAGNLAQN